MSPLRTTTPSSRTSPLLEVATVQCDGVLTIRLSGELDCASQAAARCALDDSFAGHLPRTVVIDLAQLDFCDCAGVRVLTGLQRHAAANDVTCIIKNPQPQVSWVLQAAGAESFLVIDTDRARDTPVAHRHRS
jgi:anti-sigma B factor antagonist